MGSEMCIRDRFTPALVKFDQLVQQYVYVGSFLKLSATNASMDIHTGDFRRLHQVLLNQRVRIPFLTVAFRPCFGA